MARSDDKLPEIEVVGAGVEGRTDVEYGTDAGRWRRPLVIGAVPVAILIFIGVAIRGESSSPSDEAEPTVPASQAPTPGPATTDAPVVDDESERPTGEYLTGSPAPVLGEPVKASLLVGGEDGRPWHQINLDTGWIVELATLPDVNPWCAVPVIDGLISHCHPVTQHIAIPEVGPAEHGELQRRDLLQVVLTPEEHVEAVLRSGRPDRVWVITNVTRDRRMGPDLHGALVDLEGQALITRQPLPTWPIASSVGLIVNRGGRSYLINEHGPTDLGPGTMVTAYDTFGARVSCDAAATCWREIVDVPTGETIAAFEMPIDTPEYPEVMAQAGDGSIAVITPGPDADLPANWQGTVQVLRPDGRSLHTEIDRFFPTAESGRDLTIQWLPDSRGLLAFRPPDVLHISEANGRLSADLVIDLPTQMTTNPLIMSHSPSSPGG